MKKNYLLISALFLALSACQSEPEVVETTQQNAKTDQAECMCYELYAPVCGEDGKTYPNDCHAQCADVEYTEGECQ